jgi:hypothetical protein
MILELFLEIIIGTLIDTYNFELNLFENNKIFAVS